MSTPRATVIVPMYNSELSIVSCLASLDNQTVSSLEVIVIDDGSTDQSIAVAEKYVWLRHRCTLYRQPNMGPGAARNLGIDRSNSEFVMFVDSDDIVAPDYVERLIAPLERSTGVGVSVSNFGTGQGRPIEVPALAPIQDDRTVDVSTFIERFVLRFGLTVFVASPCNKAFRVDVIRNNSVFFPIGVSIGEDFQFCMKYLAYISEVALVREGLYQYDLSSSLSLTKRKRGPRESWDDSIRQMQSLQGLLRHKKLSADDELERIAIKSVLAIIADTRFELTASDWLKSAREVSYVASESRRRFAAGSRWRLGMGPFILAVLFDMKLSWALTLMYWLAYHVKRRFVGRVDRLRIV